MSKNVKVNDVVYNGVSQVRLQTTTGGTALFKDVSEIAEPSGSVSITENGTHNVKNYASAIVNVAGGGGSIETGTFVGDGTGAVTIPVSSKKTGVLIWADNYTEEAESFAQFERLYYCADSELPFAATAHRYNNNASSMLRLMNPNTTSEYGYPTFNDDSIVIDKAVSYSQEKFASGRTYHWKAW